MRQQKQIHNLKFSKQKVAPTNVDATFLFQNRILFQIIKITGVSLIINLGVTNIRDWKIKYSNTYYMFFLITYALDFFPFLGFVGEYIPTSNKM